MASGFPAGLSDVAPGSEPPHWPSLSPGLGGPATPTPELLFPVLSVGVRRVGSPREKEGLGDPAQHAPLQAWQQWMVCVSSESKTNFSVVGG